MADEINWAEFTPAAPDRPGVPELVAALTHVESGGNTEATSPQGARGSMQIMPATFKQYAKPGESYDNDADRRAAAIRKVEADYDHFDGDPVKVAAAYIGGRGAVRTDGSIRDDVADSLGTTPAAYAERVLSRLKPASEKVNWDDFKPVAAAVNWDDFKPAQGYDGGKPRNPPPPAQALSNERDVNTLDGPLGVTASTASSDPTFTATAKPDAGAGRGLVNPPLIGQPQPDAAKDVGSLESFGRGYGKAGATMAKAANLAVVAPVVVWNKITQATDTPVQDALFRNLVDPAQRAVDWYSLKPDEKQGFLAKVSEGIGALASDLPLMIASGGASAEAKLAQAFPTMTEHLGNVISKGFDAMRPLMVKSGVEKAQQVLDAGGSPQDAVTSATTAAMLTGFMGSQPMSAEGTVAARLLTGIPVGAATSEGHRVIQNAADPENIQAPFSAEGMAVGAVTNAGMAGAMGHPAPARARDRIDLGYDPTTGKTATAQGVRDAYPTEAARATEPGQAQRPDPMGRIMRATSVDEAIAATKEAISGPLDDSLLQLRPLDPQPKAADVSQQVAPDAAVSPSARDRGAVDAGSERAGGLLDQPAGRDMGSARAPVESAGPDAVLGVRGDEHAAIASGFDSLPPPPASVEPTATWFGRAGDGYKTQGDATMALQGRAKAQPELNWRVEPMPNGKFRLAGYEAEGAKSGDATARPQEAQTATQADAGGLRPSVPLSDRDAAGDRASGLVPNDSVQAIPKSGEGSPSTVALADQRQAGNANLPVAEVSKTPPTSGVSTSGFTTAKGSTYEVHPDGTTTRNKAARSDAGHEGDQGPKERSAKTVYVDGDASALSAAGLSGVGEKGARVVIRDGKATLVTWNEAQGKWGASPSARDIPVHDEPGVGRQPLELWSKKDDVGGMEAYGKMHAGNAITEVRTPSTDAARAEAILDAAGVKGTDRISTLRDVKTGLITLDELARAHPEPDRPPLDTARPPDTTPPDRGVLHSKPERPAELIELRKRKSVLESLITCMGG